MSSFPPPSQRGRQPRCGGIQGQALVITLAFVALASILIVAFFSMVSLDRTATASYTQSLKAEQLGQGSLQMIIGQLQQEMSKDALPDTGGGSYPNSPIYTNVTSANILPQGVGTNAAMPVLLKTSSTNNFYTGTLGTGLAASTISSTTASLNGRSVSLTRWNQAYMGTFTNNTLAPNWVLITRSGPTNSGVLGVTTANSLNNPTYGNTNYVIGRVAYAIYNEGSLLDITVAGHPTSLTAAQLAQIKGTLAGTDLTALGIDPNQLTTWRNAVTAASASSYMSYVTNFAPTNSFEAVYPGDTTFLSRQDLIKAAQNGTAGLSTTLLTNLATFTREANTPSWEPTYDAASLGGSSTYAYHSKAALVNVNNPNRLIPHVRSSAANSAYMAYHDNGVAYSDPINVGDPVVRRRFSLARLQWLGPSGPQNGGTAANIQACFGLVWQTAQDTTDVPQSVWTYVGPSGTTEASSIETLDQIGNDTAAGDTTPREPNFFELLQAGMLSGSIAVDGDSGNKVPSFPSVHQAFPTLQILRVGANIINQTGTYASGGIFYPMVIEYNQSGSPWLACGTVNLPEVNMTSGVVGVAPSPPGTAQTVGETSATAATYLMFGLWNPNQVNASSLTAPPVRLHIKGSVGMANTFCSLGSPGGALAGSNGIGPSLNDTIQLSSTAGKGVNGFTALSGSGGMTCLTTADVVSGSYVSPTATGPAATTGRWENAFPLGIDQLSNLVGYRLGDLPFGLGTNSKTGSTNTLKVCYGNNSTNPFNAYMEFQTPSGNWVPYQYFTGTNSTSTWINEATIQFYYIVNIPGTPGNIATYLAPLADSAGETPGKAVYIPASAPNYAIEYWPSWDQGGLLLSNDPRSVRFNAWFFGRDSGTTPTPIDLSCYVGERDSFWIPATGSNTTAPYPGGLASGNPFPAFGGNSGTAQSCPPLFVPTSNPTAYYYPSQLARNNDNDPSALSDSLNTVSSSGSSSYTSYVDSDGLRRMGDSGVYTDQTASVGNPFYNTPDKPIILNRPFDSVAELGYVSRDDPWRSIDFFSSKSPDAGLLDLFTPAEVSTASGVTAGKIDLNSQNLPALTAALNGTISDTVNNVAMSSPATVASALASMTASTPLINKSELVTRFISSSSSGLSTGNETNLKPMREATIRALADVGQTRTWNLMIDLVAQVGRYPATATDLSQFNVEGERRYWLHIAIDRFTGKIVDKKLEAFTE